MSPRFALPALILLAACGGEPLTLYNPFNGNAITVDPQGYSERRGQVEIAVKATFPQIITDIRAGSGPVLSGAFDAAAVPLDERPARTLQLQGDVELYANNPDALIHSLVTFGG